MKPAKTSAMPTLRHQLSSPVSAQSLALFRIAFGALMLWDCWRFIKYERVWRYWIQPEFHFSYPGFSWIEPLPQPWLQIAWLGVGLAAALVMLGLFYRVAIIALTVLFGYFFLLDAAEYLNHFYLVLLYAALLCCLPAARVWSLDAWRQPRDPHVPAAAVAILRIQTEIVLIYAGLVKLTPDWLRGEPLGLWLRHRVEGFWIAPLLEPDWVMVAAAWGVIALHVVGAPLLMWHRTRLAVFLIYCVFHCANAWFFNIGIFPWLTIAATTIFFAPDWPSALFGRAAPTSPPAAPLLPRAALLAMAVWIAVQIFLPVRGALFDSETRWSGDGHRFSWRMRIYDREAEGVFIVTDHRSGQFWEVDPEEFLSRRQAGTMMTRADLIHQFANHLARIWRERGHEVAVYAEICKSLNGRPCQYYIAPGTDLTQARINPFGADPWVLPLEEPAWGAADNRRLYGGT